MADTPVQGCEGRLDGNHDRGSNPPDVRMQQATVNLLADMGVQSATLRPGLVAATASTDTTAPASTITAPSSGANVTSGLAVTISGTASDSGGGVGAVEVSVDGGATWHPASGRGTWTYAWTPGAVGSVTLRSRAVDDSGNLESASAGVTVQPRVCPCSIWDDSIIPGQPSSNDPGPVELGVRFRSDVAGLVTGLRFYKGSLNTGTHVGNLWTNTGTLLATATYSGETASGWQEVTLLTPVAIAANTTYVASYHTTSGNYAFELSYFASGGIDAAPLQALGNGVDGANGVYKYGASGFPTDTYNASNHWVDVVLTLPTPTPTVTSTPTSTATQTATATVTGTVTATASVTPTFTPLAGGCAPTPLAGCRTPGRSLLYSNSQTKLKWTWLEGDTTFAELGSPVTGTTTYRICIYDEAAGVPSLKLGASAPAGGTCGSKPCWKQIGSTTPQGFKYKDSDSTPNGLAILKLRSGDPGKAKFIVKGKGLNLQPLAAFTQDTAVIVQLVKSDGGVCWESVFLTPAAKNSDGQFKDKSP